MRRPAALEGEEDNPWVAAGEVTLAQLESWPLIRVQGEYWEEATDCIVEMVELKVSRGDRELLGRAKGTSSEALLRYISGVAARQSDSIFVAEGATAGPGKTGSFMWVRSSVTVRETSHGRKI